MRWPLEKQTSCRAGLYRPEKNDTVCLILPIHPRWLSLLGLTLLLTASGMDPACEASLTVCGSYGRSGLP